MTCEWTKSDRPTTMERVVRERPFRPGKEAAGKEAAVREVS